MGLQDRTFSFARHGEARHNEFIRDGRESEGRALLDPALTAAGEAMRGTEGFEIEEEKEMRSELVVMEVDGMKLHLTDSNRSGYLGVSYDKTKGKFQAYARPGGLGR